MQPKKSPNLETTHSAGPSRINSDRENMMVFLCEVNIQLLQSYGALKWSLGRHCKGAMISYYTKVKTQKVLRFVFCKSEEESE